MEIIRRGVIFTDLAIGQIAAVGMAISVAFFEGSYQTLLTLFFAIFAALTIAWATKYLKHVEAFIGLLYALGISSIMIILSKSAEGTEIFSKLSAADILFTSSNEFYSALAVYIPISFVMLALTVTSSVQVAGVLVVFALLIAPAYIGLAQKRFHPLAVAWGSGVFAIVSAIVASYGLDLPTGYSIIFVMVGLSLVFVVLKERKELED